MSTVSGAKPSFFGAWSGPHLKCSDRAHNRAGVALGVAFCLPIIGNFYFDFSWIYQGFSIFAKFFFYSFRKRSLSHVSIF